MEEPWRYRPDTFAHHVSDHKYKVERHLRYLGHRIARTILKGNGRLMIHAPPRHGKSWISSYWSPTWYLENWPDKRVVVAAYESKIAVSWGRKVRNEFANNPHLKVRLAEDSKAAGQWNTQNGIGGMMAVGVDCGLSGFGADLVLADDLIKDWKEAHSSTVRQATYDWWKSTLLTRLEPGASIVLAMTRWSADDLPSQLREEDPEGWEVINMPALAEDNDILGRQIGEPLCPSRYDRNALEKIRIDSGVNVWNALYQQRPDPFGAGRLFNRFSAANIDEKVQLRANQPLALSLDFNINPGNHGIVGQYDNKRDQFIITDEFYGPRMDIRTLMNHFTVWLKTKGWTPGARLAFPEIHIYGDATGESEWSGTAESCYDLVRHHLKMLGLGFKVRHLTKNPPLRESIDTVNEACRDVENKVHVLIHPRCKILINDLQKMRADEQGLIDKKEDAIGHAGDAFRYFVSYMRPLYKMAQATGGAVGGVPQT